MRRSEGLGSIGRQPRRHLQLHFELLLLFNTDDGDVAQNSPQVDCSANRVHSVCDSSAASRSLSFRDRLLFGAAHLRTRNIDSVKCIPFQVVRATSVSFSVSGPLRPLPALGFPRRSACRALLHGFRGTLRNARRGDWRADANGKTEMH